MKANVYNLYNQLSTALSKKTEEWELIHLQNEQCTQGFNLFIGAYVKSLSQCVLLILDSICT